MSRGPQSRLTLAEALPIARGRGTVQTAGRGPEYLYDFTIVSAIPVAFVRVSYCERIHAPVALIAMDFQDKLVRLRRILRHEAISQELWLRSRYGTWRFFRLTTEGLVELGRDGRLLTGENAICV